MIVQIYLLLGQDGVWGPPTMQISGFYRYFSTSRLKRGRPKDGRSGLWLSPCRRLIRRQEIFCNCLCN